MTFADRRPPRPYDVSKRLIDVAVALIGLALTAPLQALVGLLVRREFGRPVLFRQQRPGHHGQPFTLIKFRTMHSIRAGLTTDAERLTAFGSHLRRASLDELPTLWNVLRGDMSLVGPRPLLMSYLERYTPEQARRHDVRPGMTGLAQIAGRNGISWDQRLAADTEYVERRSFFLDLEILCKTVLLVIRGTGISAADEATMPEFMGAAMRP